MLTKHFAHFVRAKTRLWKEGLSAPQYSARLWSGICWRRRGSYPFANRVRGPAIKTLSRWVFSLTMRTNGERFEHVEWFEAFATTPKWTENRTHMANGTRKIGPARQSFQFGQKSRVHQSPPAIQQDKDGNNPNPNSSGQHRKPD